MQSMQRQFGKLLSKAPGDNARVSAVLNDYEDVDKVLAKLIDNARSWRDSWVNLVNTQLGVVTEYEGLYDPIEGTGRGNNAKDAVATPELQLHRTFALKQAYTELRTELLDEVTQIDSSIVRPATDARDCLAPIRKTIKKRENKRLDYEKAQDKATKLQRKPGKTAKEDAALAKAEEEVAKAAEAFQVADSHLRETLPPVVDAAFGIVPPLVNIVVHIQNRLLGLYYTTLHTYCEEHQFPSPPPPMDDVIAMWEASYNPVKQELESIGCVAYGKAVKQPMRLVDEPAPSEDRKPSTSSLNGFRRSSSNLISSNGPGPMPPRPNRIPSTTSLSTPVATPGRLSPRPSFNSPGLGVPTEFTTASGYGTSPGASPNSLRPRTDYFGPNGNRPPSVASTVASTISTSSMAAAAIKKKPPPPPPPKRIQSNKPDEFVIAQFTFTGQGAGDLSFREGDMIKVVKKTGTDQDWWIGELGGVKGSFPANYCRAA
ncbi:SH3 domain-containing protein [Xylariales sp. PMI_506]|nr:SH3 domain-containing protein [Xylariales sp. PMI_506]